MAAYTERRKPFNLQNIAAELKEENEERSNW